MFELAPFDLPADYAEGIVSLADAKAHLSVEADETGFDDLIAALRDAAVDMVERYCGVYLAPRTGAVWSAECLPRRLRLPVRPVTAVTGFAYLDSAGDAAEVDVATLRVGPGGELLPLAGVCWPAGNGFAVTFSAGYTATNRPPALVQAVKMFIAHLFTNREAVVTGTITAEIPLGFQALCAQFRPVLI
jgi:uncharacterized phiE125 gp8 family phage protein